MRLSKTILVFGRQRKRRELYSNSPICDRIFSAPCWMLSKIMVAITRWACRTVCRLAISAVFWQNCIVCSLGKQGNRLVVWSSWHYLTGFLFWAFRNLFSFFNYSRKFFRSRWFDGAFPTVCLVCCGLISAFLFPICPSKWGWSKGNKYLTLATSPSLYHRF